MISNFATLPDLIIPNASNVSQVFNSVYVYSDAVGVQIMSPAGLIESVYIEINPDQLADESSPNWGPYETFDATGASINLYVPGAGKSQTYQEVCYSGSFRLKSTTNVAADRTFKCNKLWTV